MRVAEHEAELVPRVRAIDDQRVADVAAERSRTRSGPSTFA